MFVFIFITSVHCSMIIIGTEQEFGRQNVTLGMIIEHHDVKTLCYTYIMLKNDTGMQIYGDVSV